MIADSRLALHSLRQLGFFLCVCVCVCLFVFCFLGGSLFPLIQRTLSFLFFFFYLILNFSPLANTHTHIHTRKRKKSTFEQMTQRELEKKKTHLPTHPNFFSLSPETKNWEGELGMQRVEGA